MTTSIKQLRPYILDHADILAVVLEDEAQMRPDHVEMLEIVRDALIWSEKQMYRRHGPPTGRPQSSSKRTMRRRSSSHNARRNAAMPERNVTSGAD